MLFAYHSGSQQLVFLDPESRRAQAFSIKALRMLGWSADRENCAKSLPRFDAPGPALQAAGSAAAHMLSAPALSQSAILQAAKQEKGRRTFEAKIRGR